MARTSLLSRYTTQALCDFENPEVSVCLPLEKGKAAGKLDLIWQLFPPRNVHRNSIPASYTFLLDYGVAHEIELMVSTVAEVDSVDMLIFGFIAHDHWCSLREQTGMDADAQHHWVAVKYNPTTREGYVYLYKEAYAVIEALKKDRLDQVRAAKQQRISHAVSGSSR